MSTATLDEDLCSSTKKPHLEAGIVFGTAALSPRRKPASVRATCEAIGLARSTYYYQSHRSASAIELEHKIVLRMHELRAVHPHDGYRRMTLQLQQEGFHVNRKRIARLMQLHHLNALPSKPVHGPYYSSRTRIAVSNLPETARLTGPNQIWIADIAYVHIGTGLVYAAAIIDKWSREVVGYAVSQQINHRLAGIALHSAVRARRPAPGCIHHSTCGTHYLMRGYCRLLSEYGLVPSAGPVVHRSLLSTTNGAATHGWALKAPMTASATPQDSATHASRQVIEMLSYETWDDVIKNPKDFIQALYWRERLDWILGPPPAESPSPHASTACPSNTRAVL